MRINHGMKLHPDGTLEITMPKSKKVSRVLVCEAGTQNGTLMYPDCDDCIKHGGDWECNHVNCHKDNNPDTNVGDTINRQAAIDALIRKIIPHDNGDGTMTMCVMSEELIRETLNDLPSAEPERKRGKWILTQDEDYEYCTCSECGYQNGENWMNGANIPFCAMCGSYNGGEQA